MQQKNEMALIESISEALKTINDNVHYSNNN